MPFHFTTDVGEIREDQQPSNKWSKVKDQQSEKGTSEPNSKLKNKNESRRIASDLTGINQKLLQCLEIAHALVIIILGSIFFFFY
jgi:hypothetical protein